LLYHNKKPAKALELACYTARVPAGFPSPADDHIEGKLDLNLHLIHQPNATFFVRVEGESMKNVGIFDGDLLIVDRSIYPKSNNIVIAALYGELTLKRLVKINGKWFLSSENPTFSRIPIDNTSCEIWGVVTNSIRYHYKR